MHPRAASHEQAVWFCMQISPLGKNYEPRDGRWMMDAELSGTSVVRVSQLDSCRCRIPFLFCVIFLLWFKNTQDPAFVIYIYFDKLK